MTVKDCLITKLFTNNSTSSHRRNHLRRYFVSLLGVWLILPQAAPPSPEPHAGSQMGGGEGKNENKYYSAMIYVVTRVIAILITSLFLYF